jgi:hypothetical protein
LNWRSVSGHRQCLDPQAIHPAFGTELLLCTVRIATSAK